MRLLIFSLLLTVVYSWEDIIDNLRFLIYKRKRRNKPFEQYTRDGDNAVSTMLLFFAIPLTLLYFLGSDASMVFKLSILAIELLLIALLGAGISIFNRRMKLMHQYNGLEKLGVVLFAGAGLVSPTFRLFYRHATSAPELVSKFALYLSLPALAAWVVAKISPTNIITGELLPNINGLIVVALGGLFMLIIIKFMEEHFRVFKFSLLPYTRLVLGIILLFVLSEGLI